MQREVTMLNINSIIPHVGIELDLSPLLHFFRDLVITFILWQIGYRDFQAAFGIMIASGFFEAGNGILFQSDGERSLDFLPSVLAGFLVVGFLSGKFDFQLLLTLFLIYIAVVLVLLIINVLLGRTIIIKRAN